MTEQQLRREGIPLFFNYINRLLFFVTGNDCTSLERLLPVGYVYTHTIQRGGLYPGKYLSCQYVLFKLTVNHNNDEY